MSHAIWIFVAGLSVGIVVGVIISSMVHRQKAQAYKGVAGDDNGLFRKVFGPHL